MMAAPILDLNRLAEIMGSEDAEEHKEALEFFLQMVVQVPVDLMAAIDRRDAKEVRHIAHAAKGAAATAAALKLSGLMLRIEEAAKIANWPDIAAARGEILGHFDEVRSAIGMLPAASIAEEE